MNSAQVLVEAAVDNLAHAVMAVDAGVDRLELCGDLSVGGITPDRALLLSVLERVRIPVLAMIRPRGGDFIYTPDEVERMLGDIEFVKTTNAAGIVAGALTHDDRIDIDTMRRVMKASDGLPVTFHRAFDQIQRGTPVQNLIELGVARILTSGGARAAIDSVANLGKLVVSAGSEITIVAGGGVRAANVHDLVRRTGVTEVHARFTDPVEMRNFVAAAKKADLDCSADPP